MDNRDTIRNLLIAFGIFLAVMIVGSKLLPPMPPPGAGDRGEPTPGAGAAPTGTESGAADRTPALGRGDKMRAASPDEARGANLPGGFVLLEADGERRLAIGAPDLDDAGGDPDGQETRGSRDVAKEPYRMRLVLSNVGAAVESATMTDHAQEADKPARYKLLTPVEREDGRTFRSLAVEKINVDDDDIPLLDRKWHAGEVVETQEGQSVDFWITIQHDGADALKLTRTFTLPRQTTASGRHDLRADLIVENLSSRPHRVIVTYRGGLGIPRANVFRDLRAVDVGILSADGLVAGGRKMQAKVIQQRMISLYRAGEASRLSWAATGNIYFTCTIAPLGADGGDAPGYIAEVSGVGLNGDTLSAEDATVQFVTLPITAVPGATLSYPAAVYLGEKNAKAFRHNPEYSRRNYYYQIVQGFGWCTFIFLVELMLWLLNGLFSVVRDYGVAIIILVLIVRTLLHPMTKKGQVNMVRMQHRMSELAPKIEEIKRKYANDKARMNQEMMKLNMNPAGQLLTCLPMFIQMPIWFALYLSLQNNIQMRHEPFHFTWISDLTAPDALYTFATPLTVPLLGWTIPALNLLPILVAVFMYTQQKLQPKPKPNPNATDQQRQQQEMMQKMGPMMSVMMLLIFYKMPSGLNLYIMSSSLFGTIEQMRIRKHIKEREADGTLHKPQNGAEKRTDGKPQRGPRKSSFLQRLQKMAEQAQKVQSTPKAKQRR